MKTLKFLAVVAVLAFLSSTCFAAIKYVKWDSPNDGPGNDWDHAYHSVQAAINAAVSGDEVWVAGATADQREANPSAGKYGRINLKNGVPVYGGFNGTETAKEARDWVVNQTILDANQTNSVVRAYYCTLASIDGFTIRNGKYYTGNVGGGVYCSYSTLTISNCVITGNTLASLGGGIYSYHSNLTVADSKIENNQLPNGGMGAGIYCSVSSSLTLVDSLIQGNSCRLVSGSVSGAGVYCTNSSVSILGTKISRNTGGVNNYFADCTSVQISNSIFCQNETTTYWGGIAGGIYCSNSPLKITDSRFLANVAGFGGGVYCTGGSATILNNQFRGNVGTIMGGAIYLEAPGTIKNNVFAGNSGGIGGAIYTSSTASVIIANNTIVGNHGDTSGGSGCGVIYCKSGSPTIANNIIAYNLSGISKYSSATPVLKNNCMWNDAWDYSGVSAGTGDFHQNPLLQNETCGRVHLKSGSPCIDVGDDSLVDVGDKDMDSLDRQVGQVDIGADEYDGTLWPGDPTIIRVSTEGDDDNDGSSWTETKKTIQAAIDAVWLAGGEVWVKEGTYEESIRLHAYSYLYGGFDGTETERSQRDWKKNETITVQNLSDYSIQALGGYSCSAVDGFTIRKGTGFICFCASPEIRNNNVTESTSFGINCSRRVYSKIMGNVITGNRGGIAVSMFSYPTIVNNVIADNTDSGIVSGAYGGGSGPTDALVVGNIIAGNVTTRSGGGIACTSTANKATVIGNTIVGNSSTVNGGGISGGTVLTNNIIAFNSSGVYKESSGNQPWGQYNDVFGNTAYNYRLCRAGTGSISVDPLFADPANGNYRLSPYSLCIDAGTNEGAPAIDFDGVPRPVDGDCDGVPTTDMGAFEYVPIHITIDVLPGQSPNHIVQQPNKLITVAILGSASFDASQVDALSVVFGPGRATEVHGKGHMEDVNFDGSTDMVLHFRCGETGITPGTSTVHLYGRLTNGERIEGSDIVTAYAK